MLIGLHGRARAGKDTVFRMIAEDFSGPGVNVVRDAFADRMKLSAYRCFKPDATLDEALAWAEHLKADEDVRVGTWHDGFEATGGITGREFLQYYGTHGHRDVFGQDFWVDAVLPDWHDDDYGREDGLTRNDILVLTDVRFANEVERVLDCGGSVWHIVRPSLAADDEHISEQPLPPEYISYTIENLTSLDALRAKVHLGIWNEVAQQVPA